MEKTENYRRINRVNGVTPHRSEPDFAALTQLRILDKISANRPTKSIKTAKSWPKSEPPQRER
jgi:hypothetical protein